MYVKVYICVKFNFGPWNGTEHVGRVAEKASANRGVGGGGAPNGGVSWTQRGCDIGGPCCLCQDSLVVWVSVRAGAGLTVLRSANSRVAKEAGCALLAQLPLGVVLAALHAQQICV